MNRYSERLAEHHPVQGIYRIGKRPEKFLLICWYDPIGIGTISENIAYLQELSGFNIEILNLFKTPAPLRLDKALRLDRYDGVIVHNTVSYNPENLESLDQELRPNFTQYEGVKVILKQDEHFRTHRVARYIGSRKFDLVLTCIEQEERGKAYPPDLVGTPRFMQMLTGYVTPKLRALKFSRDADRPIDICYRGSIQPISFGRLAYEKRKIGYDVARVASIKGMRTDISSKWEDRVFGGEWFSFLARSKSTLGVESGASIFDFSGEVERLCSTFQAQYPGSIDDPDYCEALLKYISEYEGNVYYNQISPRHFEAAATRTLQVLYEGKYSGIFEPWRHYVQLSRDLENFDKVAEYILDEPLRREIADRAHDEIIENPKYSIEHFTSEFDGNLDGLLEAKATKTVPIIKISKPKHHLILLCGHPPLKDPRIGWVADHAPDNYMIHVLGVHTDLLRKPIITQRKNGVLEITIGRDIDSLSWLSGMNSQGNRLGVGRAEMAFLRLIMRSSPERLQNPFGVNPNSERFSQFISLVEYFVKINSALIDYTLNFNGVQGIIAADLDTLPAGAVLKECFGVPLIYDAHEFWPDSLSNFDFWEIEFWKGVERRLLESVDHAVTVSPPLAKYMAELYKRPFGCVPNCAPAEEIQYVKRQEISDAEIAPDAEADRCIFLFQGVVAAGRGLELLIRAWPKTTFGQLWLRGPHSEYKDHLIKVAKDVGLFNKRIFFPPPVQERELVAAAADADVGIVPYEPTSINSKYCCPNKLSQYMAAGLSILSNKLEFVSEVIRKADCGLYVDFANQEELVEKINILATNKELRARFARQARRYFYDHYN